MLDLWSETGPLAYLILPFGALVVCLAIAYLRRGHRSTLALSVGTTATTLLLGVAALAAGAHRAIGPMGSLDAAERWRVAVGVGESLSCFLISLAFAILTSILLTAGAWRAARQEEGGAAVPAAA